MEKAKKQTFSQHKRKCNALRTYSSKGTTFPCGSGLKTSQVKLKGLPCSLVWRYVLCITCVHYSFYMPLVLCTSFLLFAVAFPCRFWGTFPVLCLYPYMLECLQRSFIPTVQYTFITYSLRYFPLPPSLLP